MQCGSVAVLLIWTSNHYRTYDHSPTSMEDDWPVDSLSLQKFIRIQPSVKNFHINLSSGQLVSNESTNSTKLRLLNKNTALLTSSKHKNFTHCKLCQKANHNEPVQDFCGAYSLSTQRHSQFWGYEVRHK